MECLTFDKIKLSVDVEKRFCKIYESVISNYFLFNNELLSNINKMLDAGRQRQTIKMDHLSYQLPFLLSFSVQDTCLSVQAFYESLMDDDQIVEKISNNNLIKLLCLESESLPTVIGVCQVLDEIFEMFGCEWNFDYWEIRVLVIENGHDWERLCGCIVETVNSYFKNIDLKLDFVGDYPSWTSQELIDRIKESDLVIIARFFEKYRDSTLDIKFLEVVLDKMKEKAIIFWFDYYTNKYYKALRKYILNKNSFSEVKSSKHFQASFKKLADDEYCLDLAINWDTDCKSVMFSTWINHGLQNKESVKTAEIIISNQPKCAKTSKKARKKKGKKKRIALSKDITPMISSQMSLQLANILHIQSQHSSLVTALPGVQTMETCPLEHVKTTEITMSHQSNPRKFATMPEKATKEKIKIKEFAPHKCDTHAISSQKSPQQTTSLHIQSQHPSLVRGDSMTPMQTAFLYFQSQPSSPIMVTSMPPVHSSTLRLQSQPSSLVTTPSMPTVNLASLNFQAQPSSLVTVPSIPQVRSASLPKQSEQPPLVTIPSVPICVASNFLLENRSRIPRTHRSITPFAPSLPNMAPPQPFSFQSNPREMTGKQSASPSTSHNEGLRKHIVKKM